MQISWDEYVENCIERQFKQIKLTLEVMADELKRLQQSREAHSQNHAQIFEKLETHEKWFNYHSNYLDERLKKLEVSRKLHSDNYAKNNSDVQTKLRELEEKHEEL